MKNEYLARMVVDAAVGVLTRGKYTRISTHPDDRHWVKWLAQNLGLQGCSEPIETVVARHMRRSVTCIGGMFSGSVTLPNGKRTGAWYLKTNAGRIQWRVDGMGS